MLRSVATLSVYSWLLICSVNLVDKVNATDEKIACGLFRNTQPELSRQSCEIRDLSYYNASPDLH